jgi:hypothetical protein
MKKNAFLLLQVIAVSAFLIGLQHLIRDGVETNIVNQNGWTRQADIPVHWVFTYSISCKTRLKNPGTPNEYTEVRLGMWPEIYRYELAKGCTPTGLKVGTYWVKNLTLETACE